MSREYEKIRVQVANKYKDEITNLKNELAAAKETLEAKEKENSDLKKSNADYEAENKKLRELIGKTDEEIDRMVKAHDGVKALSIMMGALGSSSPFMGM